MFFLNLVIILGLVDAVIGQCPPEEAWTKPLPPTVESTQVMEKNIDLEFLVHARSNDYAKELSPGTWELVQYDMFGELGPSCLVNVSAGAVAYDMHTEFQEKPNGALELWVNNSGESINVISKQMREFSSKKTNTWTSTDKTKVSDDFHLNVNFGATIPVTPLLSVGIQMEVDVKVHSEQETEVTETKEQSEESISHVGTEVIVAPRSKVQIVWTVYKKTASIKWKLPMYFHGIFCAQYKNTASEELRVVEFDVLDLAEYNPKFLKDTEKHRLTFFKNGAYIAVENINTALSAAEFDYDDI